MELTITLKQYFLNYGFTLGRFAILGGFLYFIVWKIFSKSFADRKIPNKFPSKPEVKLEFLLTSMNLILFSLISVAIAGIKHWTGYFIIYRDIAQYGWLWFFASMLLAAIFTDTYFYWFHRLIHRPRIFKVVHKLHHRFTNPSPWSAYSLDVIEGFVLAFSFFLVLLLIPMHPVAIIIYTTYGIFWNAFIHLGYEFFPKRWATHPVLKWINTSTHHSLHHQYYSSNFSLYFTFWDKVLKTEHPRTVSTLEKRSES